MFNKLKSQKGITGIDITISLIIIMLFVSIIAALSINVSSSLASKRRLEVATNCITEIMEKVDSIDYENIEETKDEKQEYVFFTIKNINNETENITYDLQANPSKLDNEIAGILEKKSDYDILSVFLKVENYYPTENETADLLKKVTIKITYKLNNQEEGLEVTRLKPRYNVDFTKPETN